MADAIPERRKNRLLRGLVVLAIISGLVLVVLYRNQIDPGAIVEWARKRSLWETSLEFLIAHVIAGQFFVPRLFMGLAAGVLFGPIVGSVLSVIGGTLSSLVGFLLVRFVNADSVRLRETPAIGRWLARAESQGWRLVFVVRLIPVLPHSLVNYVFGLSRMSIGAYFIGSALGLIPTSIIYANLGASGRGVAESSANITNYLLLAAWGLGLIFVSWLVPKLANRMFPQEREEPKAP